MARDALHVLARVRQAAVDQARRTLAEAMVAERLASGQLDAQHGLIGREQAAAEADTLAPFVAWLPVARGQVAQLRSAVDAAAGRVAACQRSLAARRVDAEAVVKATARRDERDTLARNRRDQAAMDEAAGRSKPA